jgi:hypothetical protein
LFALDHEDRSESALFRKILVAERLQGGLLALSEQEEEFAGQ